MRRGPTPTDEPALGGRVGSKFLPAKEYIMTRDTALIELEQEGEDETDRVLRWRCEELRRAGYGLQDALLLAITSEVDLHLAADLLARGCPNGTAIRILV